MPNLQHLWADLLVEELRRQGVGLFVVQPGSRSTPLTSAVARNTQIERVVHLDERGGAFCALGYARATGRPAAWITTSGTAVANGLPAVVEAAQDDVPMILLTADRPPELRQTGANQTIYQPGLFGPYVRWHADLPVPSADVDPAAALTTAAQAVFRARRGPVHLNVPLRKPLDPVEIPEEPDLDTHAAHLAAWRNGDAPYTRYAEATPSPADADLDALVERLRHAECGLLVAGRLPATTDRDAVFALAEALGWPLATDPASQVRLGDDPSGCRIAYADLVLASRAFIEAHRPDAVLYLGAWGVSKKLDTLLAEARPETLAVVHAGPERIDPHHQVTHRLQARPDEVARRLAERLWPSASSWRDGWRAADARAAEALDQTLADDATLSEAAVTRKLTQHLGEGHGLVLAASLPVRHVGQYAVHDGEAVHVAANRGASGIDGTVATAAGFARGLGQPVTLLIGDLALLHDLNSLLLLRDLPVVVVTLNNDGGGIFHFLPIAQHPEVFDPYFTTPHGVTFEGTATLFGLSYRRAMDLDGFVETYTEALQSDGPTLIEVRTERTTTHALAQEIETAVIAALEDAA